MYLYKLQQKRRFSCKVFSFNVKKARYSLVVIQCLQSNLKIVPIILYPAMMVPLTVPDTLDTPILFR